MSETETAFQRRQKLLELARKSKEQWLISRRERRIDEQYVQSLKEVLGERYASPEGLTLLSQRLAQSINLSGLDSGIGALFSASGVVDVQRFCAALNAISLEQRLAALARSSELQKRRHDAIMYLMKAAWHDEWQESGLPSWQSVCPTRVSDRLIDWAAPESDMKRKSQANYLGRIGQTIESSKGADVQKLSLAACCVPSLVLFGCISERGSN